MSPFMVTEADDATAQRMLAEYFADREHTFPTAGGYRATFPDPARFTGSAGAFLLVTDERGEAIGCGGIRALPAETGVRFEVKHLFIRNSARGGGLGRALLTELERLAVQRGATELVLDTNDSLVAAAALYRSCGFERIAAYNDNPNATSWYRKAVAG